MARTRPPLIEIRSEDPNEGTIIGVHPDFVSSDSLGYRFPPLIPSCVVLTSIDREPPLRFEFPFGPQTIAISQTARSTSQLARPFEKPLLLILNKPLVQVRINAQIADKVSHGTQSVTEVIDTLRAMSDGVICKLVYGTTAIEQQLVITQCSYVVTHRNFDGDPVQAAVDIMLTEYAPYTQDILELRDVPSPGGGTVTTTTEEEPGDTTEGGLGDEDNLSPDYGTLFEDFNDVQLNRLRVGTQEAILDPYAASLLGPELLTEYENTSRAAETELRDRQILRELAGLV